MTEREPDSVLAEALSALRVHDASRDRVEEIRLRCLAELAARRRAQEAQTDQAPGWRRWLEPVLAFGFAGLYLAEVVSRVLEVYR
jgi:hypothetical protein